MPTLLEIQRAIHHSVVEGDDLAAVPHIFSGDLAPEARLQVYRNTYLGTLTKALRLSYPAVNRLVGDEFFESAAHIFVKNHPPESAYLDEYGANFSDFLEDFEPANGLPYLPDVTRLEWAVSCALNAPDADPLDLSRLSAIDPSDHGSLVLTPHPAVNLLRTDYPADDVWRAVLAQDDAAMARIDLAAGPAWLLVRRTETGVESTRLGEPTWRFISALCTSQTLLEALDTAAEIDTADVLAEYLAKGLFVDFKLNDRGTSDLNRRSA